jgi:hypothetical protein
MALSANAAAKERVTKFWKYIVSYVMGASADFGCTASNVVLFQPDCGLFRRE